MSDIKRRDFLKVVGLSGAGTGLLGCAQEPAQKLIPYLVPPEEIIPGVAAWYSSVCRECPAGCGVHVKVREGRPIKVEGNPDHPVNAGRLCARGQASLQGLYNPDLHDLKKDSGRRAVDDYVREGYALGSAISSGAVADSNSANNRQIALPLLGKASG